MTQRLKSCVLLLLIATSSARGLSNGETIFATAAISIVTLLGIEHLLIPAISGSWERQRQEQLAQELAAQQARDRAHAQRVMADTSSAYAPEIKQLGHLTKEDLVTIITGKYGNRELKFFTYDHELDATLAKLANVNTSALEPAEQATFYALLNNIRDLHRQKNLLLSAEITKQIEQNRNLTYQQARFNAELDTQQKLKEVIRDVHGVVQEQANNRTWMETMLTGISSRVKDDGRETRQLVRDEAQRNEHRWSRQEGHWDRLNDYQRRQEDRDRDRYRGA
jgi:hypothetical protein